MDFSDIRRLVVIAMFSDDVLMSRFVLKGGNALDLIHKLGTRTSLDVDLSIEDDFKDLDDTRSRIFKALRDRFDSAGYVVFDEVFQPKPSTPRPGQEPKWGGYRVEFKLIEKDHVNRLRNDSEQLRRNALVLGPSQQRKFGIDISKYEFCTGKAEVELDHFTIYVYTLPMIAIEKLRAICQQLPEYALQSNRHPRARDFFDIHSICTKGNVDLTLPENIALLRNIFAAKDVPISFVFRIHQHRDLHEEDWPSVVDTVVGPLRDFSFYFDFVVDLARRLEALGIE